MAKEAEVLKREEEEEPKPGLERRGGMHLKTSKRAPATRWCRDLPP